MMAFERPPTENHLSTSERPETSKFSRQSKRLDFHMSFTDFSSTNNPMNKTNQPSNRKHETQTVFYNSKTKFPKTQSFATIKNPSETHSSANEEDRTPVHKDYNEGRPHNDIDNSMNRTGNELVFTDQEIKQGMTLDKFLGASFKKISIHDSSFKEFERNKQEEDDDDIDKKINDLSELDEREYQYESFEILETDDEEDTMSEINQTRYKDEGKTHVQRENRGVSENHEVLSKIQNKYKSSKPKYLPKNKPKSFRVRSPLKENDDFDFEKNIIENIQNNQRNSHGSSSRKDSKSLSPKFRNTAENMRFVRAVSDSLQNPKENDLGSLDSLTEVGKAMKQEDSLSGSSLARFQSSSKNSSNAFMNSNENQKNTADKFRSTFVRKTAYNKPMIQFCTGTEFFDGNKHTGERERSVTRSNSITASYKPMETAPKFQLERGNIEQKFMRENKMIEQKIKQSEKDMMDKYSKMFNLNQHEVLNLCKENEKKNEGIKRISTPLKEFNFIRGLPKR